MASAVESKKSENAQPRPGSQKQKITSHILDPDGDIILVLSTKDAIVSGANVVDLITAEKWNLEANKPKIDGQKYFGTVNGGQAVTKYTCGIDDIEVRVSSRHLSLVSPVFKALLSQDYSEGQELRENGCAEIVIEDDPISGMLVLLKILHCNFEAHNMTPSLLMQVALMADKYDVAARILYWSQVWCLQIKDRIPTSWSPDVVSFMGMFKMLKVEDQKQAMMNLARGHVTGSTCEHDLPIQHILDDLNEDRVAGLIRAFESLTWIVDRYCNSKIDSTICRGQKRICVIGKHLCDATVLGLLLKGLSKGRLWPLPSTPFEGLSLIHVLECLKETDVPNKTIRLDKERYSTGRGYSNPAAPKPELCCCEGLDDIIKNLQTAAELRA